MQDRLAPCVINDTTLTTSELVSVQDTTDAHSLDVYDMAEIVAGYIDCMEEAVRYLVEVELYPESHPAVQGLRQHLAAYQQQLLKEALTPRPAPGS